MSWTMTGLWCDNDSINRQHPAAGLAAELGFGSDAADVHILIQHTVLKLIREQSHVLGDLLNLDEMLECMDGLRGCCSWPTCVGKRLSASISTERDANFPLAYVWVGSATYHADQKFLRC